MSKIWGLGQFYLGLFIHLFIITIGHEKIPKVVFNLEQGGWFSWWSQRERNKRTK